MNTELISIKNLDLDSINELRHAAEIIRRGGLVVFPTETVYGIGADATNADAAAKIFKAKGRPSDNPLIIHIAAPEDAKRYTFTNDTYFKLAEAFMPGPLTIILPARECIPQKTRASLPTVAVRCPEHPVARKLIELSGVPIAAPSANLSGSPSPTKAKHVIDDMTGRVDMIIDGGDSEFGLESTIVKIDGDGSLTLLRPGKITVDDLMTVCPDVKVAGAVTDKLKDGETVLSPGMKYKHYAPSADVFLVDGDVNSAAEYIAKRASQCRVAVICYEEDLDLIRNKAPDVLIYNFGKREDEITQAHMLFDILRDADKRELDEIYAPLPRAEGLGLALYNRMIRAAGYHIIRM